VHSKADEVPASSGIRYQKRKNKEKLKNKTELLGRNAPDNSMWRQSEETKWTHGRKNLWKR